MKNLVFVTLAFLITSGAFAAEIPPVSQPTPPPPETVITIVNSDYNRLMADINQLIASYNQEITAKDSEISVLRKHNEDMDAYLKACSDKPGCTQPVSETEIKR